MDSSPPDSADIITAPPESADVTTPSCCGAPESADVTTTVTPPESADVTTGDPHPSLFLVLAYLPLPSLIAAHRVCRLFRDAIATDVLLYRHVAVNPPLSLRLTDNILLKITARAGGTLRSLVLADCWNVTDNGIFTVVEQNPGITKLCVPGCPYLTGDGLVRAVKRLYDMKRGLKVLRIRGISNVAREHYDSLSCLLYGGVPRQRMRPTFYGYGQSFRDDEDQQIDVDVCPKCEEVTMVYDCTRETCSSKKSQGPECRGCFSCIARCEECGGCMEWDQIEEAACSDLLCLFCWLILPKCNRCNQPYCKKHASAHEQSSGSDGFVCERCLSLETSPTYCFN